MKSNARKMDIKKRIRQLVPRASMEDILSIETIALAGHLRHLPPSISAWQAVTTHIRHVHTEYELMLGDGYDRESARHFVLDDINRKLVEWGCTRQVEGTD